MVEAGDGSSTGIEGRWIEVRLTPEDLRAASRAAWKKSGLRLWFWLAVLAMLTLEMYALGAAPLPATAACTVLWPAAIAWTRSTKARMQHTAGSGSGRIRVSQSGFEFESPTRRTWMAWTAFVGISEHPEQVRLMFSKSDGWIVPTRSFASEDDALAFVRYVRRWIDDDSSLEVLEPDP